MDGRPQDADSGYYDQDADRGQGRAEYRPEDREEDREGERERGKEGGFNFTRLLYAGLGVAAVTVGAIWIRSRFFSSGDDDEDEKSREQITNIFKFSSNEDSNNNLRDGYGPYRVAARGVNSQGNLWEKYDYGPNVRNPNTHRYFNANGSSYASNPDGTTSYNRYY